MTRAIARVRRCDDMAEVRAEVDALDSALVPLLVTRCGYMAEAARIKQDAAEVRDMARVEAIVRRVRRMAEREGGNADLLETIYRALMEACIAHEAREFARLRAGRSA